MRFTETVNNNWLYTPRFRDIFTDPDYRPDDSWEQVNLPHGNIELPYNCFDEGDFQFVSTYRNILPIPPAAEGGLVFLDFDGVMTEARVWINGRSAGVHRGGYTPFSIDITPFALPGEGALVTVRVDSRELEDIPPFGNVIDYLTYGGIYRDVTLRIVPPVYLDSVFPRPGNILEDKKTLTAGIQCRNTLEEAVDGNITVTLLDDHGKILAKKRHPCSLSPGVSVHDITLDELENILLWSPSHPKLYTLTTVITTGRDGKSDRVSVRCGFRTARFTDKGFFLNGTPMNLRGLNRHQSYPYVGYAMPAREQRRDADRLRFDLGVNLVRTSHYPQSPHFLDRCDETGLLVFEEIPGWQHLGSGDWKQTACKNLEEMIRRDRHHPSIILWGVRINESVDDHEFYTETNRLAKELDDTRQTGGVRYLTKSELLEDVYTMNDFVHCGGDSLPLRSVKKVTGGRRVPYLVTEFNGHMFPTKRFDQEERLAEHALRHLRVLNHAAGDEGISGAVGWCAWDYNTHREFGSGDRICYHGVADMFRIPKYAAAVYASQMDPEEKIVLEPASLFAKGERSAARILPIYVFTNCEALILYKNDQEVDTLYPARDEYPHLEHPPVIIRDIVGKRAMELPFSDRDRRRIRDLMSYVMVNGEEKLKPRHYLALGLFMKRNRLKFPDIMSLFMTYNAGWGSKEDTYTLAGIIRGKEVARKTYGAGSVSRLAVKADDTSLTAGDWDTTRVEFRVEDQYGNIMPFVNEYIRFHVSGPGEVIGPECTGMIGGAAACWVKTHGKPGIIRISGECSRRTSEEVVITVEEGPSRDTDHYPRMTEQKGSIPLDPDSPWPKFRCNPCQNGRSALAGKAVDRRPWSYPTGKGIFSSPVIDSGGTVYIGSADHYFYALASDGTLKWRFATEDIIDSSALLDDRGRVYFGSGDGHVYCLDRNTGEEVWRFRAHTAAEVTEEFGIKTYNLNWFEGNIAMLLDGTILAGNDNYLLYALNRDTGELVRVYPANEMIWSCPAVNADTGRIYFTSDFTALKNIFCFDESGRKIWSSGGLGTVSASPMLTSAHPKGAVLVGGFDGILRAFSQENGKRLWKFGARDHIYGSPAQLSDGTVVQAACDGTVYGLDPASGREHWSFDALSPVRSSPAIDGDDRIYFGAGDGHLYCLDGDGSFRWAWHCIDDDRNDLNGSPALGPEGVVIGGENGGIFFVPYDYPLTTAGKKDDRAVTSPVQVLPDSGARLFFVNGFGRLYPEPPETLAVNEPVTLTHLVRQNGKTLASKIDPKSLYVMVSGSPQFHTEVSADRKFLSVIPKETWEGDTLDIGIRCRFKTNLRRFGLKFFGGRKTENFDFSFSFSLPPRTSGTVLPFRIPGAPGEPADVLEISRFSCPNPTILPSYNQIGFDSLHYLAGFVEGEGDHAVLWAVQGRLDEKTGKTLQDPGLKEMYALNMAYHGGLVTLYNYEGFKLSFFGSWDMPFGEYRVSSSFDETSGTWAGRGTFSGMIRAGEIKFYGTFLKLLGMADGKTGRMQVSGAVDLDFWKEGPVQSLIDPSGIALEAGPARAAAEIPPGVFPAADFAPGILLVDAGSGNPVGADYSRKTSVETDTEGFVRRVSLDYREKPVHGRVRVYLMANTAVVCRAEIEIR